MRKGWLVFWVVVSALVWVLIFSILAQVAHSRPWTQAEKLAWWALYTPMWAADWHCTSVGTGRGHEEEGQARLWIGEHPSRAQVNNFFLSAYLFNYLLLDKVSNESFSVVWLIGHTVSHRNGARAWGRQGIRVAWQW